MGEILENISIGQTVDFTILIASLISAVSVIVVAVNKVIDKQFKNRCDGMMCEINQIKKDIKTMDVGQCKNFLVRFLKDIEQGNEVDEVERERASEVYDHYKNDLGQNSYIHDKWEKLMK